MKRCRLLLLTLTLILCLCAPAQAAELPFLREEEAREDCALLLEESADGVADLALALLEPPAGRTTARRFTNCARTALSAMMSARPLTDRRLTKPCARCFPRRWCRARAAMWNFAARPSSARRGRRRGCATFAFSTRKRRRTWAGSFFPRMADTGTSPATSTRRAHPPRRPPRLPQRCLLRRPTSPDGSPRAARRGNAARRA